MKIGARMSYMKGEASILKFRIQNKNLRTSYRQLKQTDYLFILRCGQLAMQVRR